MTIQTERMKMTQGSGARLVVVAVVRDRTARALVAASMTAELLVGGQRPRRARGSTTHGVRHRAPCPVAVVPISSGATR